MKRVTKHDAPPPRDTIALLTASELASLLKISSRTVWRLLREQKIPAPVRLGGSVRWRCEEIHCWIQDGCPSR